MALVGVTDIEVELYQNITTFFGSDCRFVYDEYYSQLVKEKVRYDAFK